MTENEIHAHIETYSSDCDGSYTGTYLLTMTDAERASDFADIEFHNRVLASVVNTYSLDSEGRLTVSRLADGDVRLSWSEPTEEGRRDVEATICTDPCDLGEESTFRDHRAEEMGY
jgi:hypothetical protein